MRNASGLYFRYVRFAGVISGAYTTALGGTVTTPNAAQGLVAGMGTFNNYGTRGMATFNPRQVQLRATVRF